MKDKVGNKDVRELLYYAVILPIVVMLLYVMAVVAYNLDELAL